MKTARESPSTVPLLETDDDEPSNHNNDSKPLSNVVSKVAPKDIMMDKSKHSHRSTCFDRAKKDTRKHFAEIEWKQTKQDDKGRRFRFPKCFKKKMNSQKEEHSQQGTVESQSKECDEIFEARTLESFETTSNSAFSPYRRPFPVQTSRTRLASSSLNLLCLCPSISSRTHKTREEEAIVESS